MNHEHLAIFSVTIFRKMVNFNRNMTSENIINIAVMNPKILNKSKVTIATDDVIP